MKKLLSYRFKYYQVLRWTTYS